MSNILSDAVRTKIAKELGKYPTKQAAVKSSLRYAQDEHGWVSDDVVKAVAQELELEPIQVYEVATFYDFFEVEPAGRHNIRVCTNVTCMLCGSDDIVARLQKRLGVGLGETTPDGKFTLREAECLAACGGAPMMMIGDEFYENLTPERVDRIIEELD
ncbi:MAG: NADH-quinone oxidoreductase subunit NuoE [Gammaproteobacteria bacterium]|nr:NADH-quinone oxidoreductase subunit NuoE [Gammaproteobacteria bacterium]